MTNLLLAALVLAAGLAFYVRVAPSDPAIWHVDPLEADDPGRKGVLLLPGPEARTYAVPPRDLLAAFDAHAMAQPRVARLAGSLDDLHVTYIARSDTMGFPDYISVRAVPAADGAQLAVFSRLRFGGGDLGVNRARLDHWRAALEARLDPA